MGEAGPLRPRAVGPEPKTRRTYSGTRSAAREPRHDPAGARGARVLHMSRDGHLDPHRQAIHRHARGHPKGELPDFEVPVDGSQTVTVPAKANGRRGPGEADEGCVVIWRLFVIPRRCENAAPPWINRTMLTRTFSSLHRTMMSEARRGGLSLEVQRRCQGGTAGHGGYFPSGRGRSIMRPAVAGPPRRRPAETIRRISGDQFPAIPFVEARGFLRREAPTRLGLPGDPSLRLVISAGRRLDRPAHCPQPLASESNRVARLGGALEQADEALIQIGHVASIPQDLIRHHEQHRGTIGTHDGEQLAIVARIRHVAHAPIGEVRPQELSNRRDPGRARRRLHGPSIPQPSGAGAGGAVGSPVIARGISIGDPGPSARASGRNACSRPTGGPSRRYTAPEGESLRPGGMGRRAPPPERPSMSSLG